jgi:hypothetical protein
MGWLAAIAAFAGNAPKRAVISGLLYPDRKEQTSCPTAR